MAGKKGPQSVTSTMSSFTQTKAAPAKESSAAPAKESSVDFGLFAPKAKKVSVAGSFNNWNTNDLKLRKDEKGNWSGSARLKLGRYEYLFVVDGEWINDPKARETVSNPFGTINSVLTVR
jgi:1,4-alpha-glucan branching enzyme